VRGRGGGGLDGIVEGAQVTVAGAKRVSSHTHNPTTSTPHPTPTPNQPNQRPKTNQTKQHQACVRPHAVPRGAQGGGVRPRQRARLVPVRAVGFFD
jgi:hypothetical protein